MSVQADNLHVYRVVGGSVTAVYLASAVYRSGILHRILPTAITKPVDEMVGAVLGKQPPQWASSYLACAEKHLLPTFGRTLEGFVLSVAGSMAFYLEPRVPIMLPIALTAIPCLATFLVPQEEMTPIGRRGLYALMAFSCGYSFGPINVTFPTLIGCPFFSMVTSVIFGATVTTVICRTKVSQIIHCQILSCAAGMFTLAELQRRAPSPIQPQTWIILQVLLSGALSAYTLWSISKWEKDVKPVIDIEREATMLYGVSAITFFTVARLVVGVILRTASHDKRQSAATRRQLQGLGKTVLATNQVVATFMCLSGYILVVSHLQGKFGQTFAANAGTVGKLGDAIIGFVLP
mmetsp:Transcript_7664/g.17693  ORF Transcript_7664/g.17693 Transcript_7664/m.17693 type:complete len:349 (+) Transcript_7664:16-1062(+)